MLQAVNENKNRMYINDKILSSTPEGEMDFILYYCIETHAYMT